MRNIVAGIITVTISAVALTGCGQSDAPKATTVKGPGTLVYAKVDLPEKTKTEAKDFEERKVDDENLPADAVQKLSELKGHQLKYNIVKGQLVSKEDLK